MIPAPAFMSVTDHESAGVGIGDSDRNTWIDILLSDSEIVVANSSDKNLVSYPISTGRSR